VGPARVNGRAPYPIARLSDGQPRAILFDAGKCIGCRQCVEACKDWNDLPRGDYFDVSGSTWLAMMPPVLEGLSEVWGRKSCMHCEYPLCAAVCPVEAITKYEEGPVVIDQATCIGCEYCIHACPWHVIGKHAITGKAAKCTMCVDRIQGGEAPFCVQICPVEALSFGPAADIGAQAHDRAQQLDASVYGEKEAGGTHVLNVLTAPLASHGMPAVPAERFPKHHIPFRTKVLGLFTLTGGLEGKRRAVLNALAKPWRLTYRYLQR
jgi:Fe-S-cluster-containing dehydrogenase component